MKTTPRGYPYPEPSDRPPDAPAAFAALANSIDIDIEKINRIITPAEVDSFESRLVNTESRVNQMEQTYNAILPQLEEIMKYPPFVKAAKVSIYVEGSPGRVVNVYNYPEIRAVETTEHAVEISSPYPIVSYVCKWQDIEQKSLNMSGNIRKDLLTNITISHYKTTEIIYLQLLVPKDHA